MNIKNDIDMAYTRLAAAIIQATIDDYKSAVKSKNTGKQRALVKWFKGKWCDALSMGNGELILEKVQKDLGIFERAKGDAK